MNYEDHSIAIDALCIWEIVIEQANRGSRDLLEWIMQPEGAYQGRENALELAKFAGEAWEIANEDLSLDGRAFDWDFIPAYLSILAESLDCPGDLTETTNVLAAMGTRKLLLRGDQS